jgi:very-short-patch-repair endonuclease
VGGPPGRDHVKVDFLWRAERLVVETDGWATHGTRWSFEDDRLKDQRLRLAGFDPLRVTARQVQFEPGRLNQLLLRLLVRAA